MSELTRHHNLGSYVTFLVKNKRLIELAPLINKKVSQAITKPLVLLQRSHLGVPIKLPKTLAQINSLPTESEKLENMVTESHEALLSATTVFPFVLFPNSIHIDRQKLTIVHRSMFQSAITSSVSLNDIQNVEVGVGPIFGSLILTSKFFQNNTQSINYLRRNDVIKIQQLLQGYMVAKHSGINVTSIPSDRLIILLNDLGGSSI